MIGSQDGDSRKEQGRSGNKREQHAEQPCDYKRESSCFTKFSHSVLILSGRHAKAEEAPNPASLQGALAGMIRPDSAP